MKTKIHKIQPQNWEDVPELSFQTSQTIGDRGYLFGGCVDAPGQRLTFSNELWSYDFAHDKWEAVQCGGEAPCPRALACSAAIEDRMYVFGGYDITSEGQFRCYNGMYVLDTTRRMWSSMPARGDMPTPRAGACMCTRGSKIYMFGGSQGSEVFFKDLYVFDTETCRWTLLSGAESPLHPRCGASIACVEETLYIFGGWIQKPEENGKRTQKAVNDMHLFDLNREVWTCMKTKGSAPTPRTGHCCVTFDGCFYIICGGVTNTHPRKSVHKFDPSKKTWSRIGKLPHCIGCTAFLHPFNSQIYLYGGRGFRTEVVKEVFMSNIYVLTVGGDRRATTSFARLQATPVKRASASTSAPAPEASSSSATTPEQMATQLEGCNPFCSPDVEHSVRSPMPAGGKMRAFLFDWEEDFEEGFSSPAPAPAPTVAVASLSGKENHHPTPFDSPSPAAQEKQESAPAKTVDLFDELFDSPNMVGKLRGVAGRSPLVKVHNQASASDRRRAVHEALFSTPFSP